MNKKFIINNKEYTLSFDKIPEDSILRNMIEDIESVSDNKEGPIKFDISESLNANLFNHIADYLNKGTTMVDLNPKELLQLIELVSYFGLEKFYLILIDTFIKMYFAKLKESKKSPSSPDYLPNNPRDLNEYLRTPENNPKVNEYIRLDIILGVVELSELAENCLNDSDYMDICKDRIVSICNNFVRTYKINEISEYTPEESCDITRSLLGLMNFIRKDDSKPGLTMKEVLEPIIKFYKDGQENNSLFRHIHMRDDVLIFKMILNKLSAKDSIRRCMVYYSPNIFNYILKDCNMKREQIKKLLPAFGSIVKLISELEWNRDKADKIKEIIAIYLKHAKINDFDLALLSKLIDGLNSESRQFIVQQIAKVGLTDRMAEFENITNEMYEYLFKVYKQNYINTDLNLFAFDNKKKLNKKYPVRLPHGTIINVGLAEMSSALSNPLDIIVIDNTNTPLNTTRAVEINNELKGILMKEFIRYSSATLRHDIGKRINVDENFDVFLTKKNCN